MDNAWGFSLPHNTPRYINELNDTDAIALFGSSNSLSVMSHAPANPVWHVSFRWSKPSTMDYSDWVVEDHILDWCKTTFDKYIVQHECTVVDATRIITTKDMGTLRLDNVHAL
jgi:hypothetical protein